MSVSFRYSGSFSLAMLKPYYLKLLYVDYAHGGQVHLQEERYSEDNNELFLNSNRIFGGRKLSRIERGVSKPASFKPCMFGMTQCDPVAITNCLADRWRRLTLISFGLKKCATPW